MIFQDMLSREPYTNKRQEENIDHFYYFLILYSEADYVLKSKFLFTLLKDHETEMIADETEIVRAIVGIYEICCRNILDYSYEKMGQGPSGNKSINPEWDREYGIMRKKYAEIQDEFAGWMSDRLLND